MKIEHKVIVLSVIFGLLVGIFDTVIDYLFFYEESFVDLLIFDVPRVEIYTRLVIVATFLVFGVLISKVLGERRQAEEALRESEEKYRRLFEDSFEGVAISKGNQVISANKALLDIMGYESLEEYLKVPLLEHVAPESLEMAKERMKKRAKGELMPSRDEYKILRKDGETIDVEVSSAEVVIGNEKYVQTTIRDITDRKLTEEALRESEEKYRTLVENSSDCICHIDLDGNFIYMNPGGVRLNELNSFEDVCGKDCTTGIKEEHKDLMKRSLERARQGKTTVLEYESKTVKGTNKWWESIVGPIKDDKGKVVSLVRISRDITRRKQADEELKRYSSELEESNRLKDLFIDIMRHHLLSPAGTAKNMAEVALGSEEDPEKKEALQIIFRSNKRIINMIENASTIAKLESGEKLAFDEIDLGSAMKRAIKETTPLAEDKGTKVTLKADGEFKAFANPLIHDVFSNLINNAIKYGPKNSEVIIGIEEEGPNYKISVADNGEGIPDKYKEAVFDRFKRIEKGGIKGTGLGLAIVKKVVEVHHGKTWVEDNPGGGSIFYVTLPKK